jgi:HEPN domain-containing protein
MNEADRQACLAEARAWLSVASHDARAAEICLAAIDPVVDVAAYHCQQAAEKLIKGVLVSAGQTFRKTHDLDELADQAALIFPEFRASLDAVRTFTDWASVYRYPSLDDLAAPLPSSAELLQAIQAIRALQAEIANRLET